MMCSPENRDRIPDHRPGSRGPGPGGHCRVHLRAARAGTPGTGEQIDYLPQSQPQNVWANLEKTLEATHAPGWEDNISSVGIRLPSRR